MVWREDRDEGWEVRAEDIETNTLEWELRPAP